VQVQGGDGLQGAFEGGAKYVKSGGAEREKERKKKGTR
jgi:hypothetical protein